MYITSIRIYKIHLELCVQHYIVTVFTEHVFE